MFSSVKITISKIPGRSMAQQKSRERHTHWRDHEQNRSLMFQCTHKKQIYIERILMRVWGCTCFVYKGSTWKKAEEPLFPQRWRRIGGSLSPPHQVRYLSAASFSVKVCLLIYPLVYSEKNKEYACPPLPRKPW